MQFAVVLLAGGEGRRIGGDKPLRRLAGETLIDRALSKAKTWSDIVRVAAKPESVLPVAAGERLDDDPAIEGPLGGLAAALAFAAGSGLEAVLTIPCDSPFLPDDLAARLAAAIGSAKAAIAASGGELYPVCGLWRGEALEALPTYVATGRRSLRGFAALLDCVEVDWPGGANDPFFNINSEADLAAAEDLLRSR